jgi:hypothetical protein
MNSALGQINVTRMESIFCYIKNHFPLPILAGEVDKYHRNKLLASSISLHNFRFNFSGRNFVREADGSY